ncbi:MAG: hypothetical protein LIP23_09420 [Planctomycetes bacterium]|nr:hypothetical protein [Planctomycetota bacterium]
MAKAVRYQPIETRDILEPEKTRLRKSYVEDPDAKARALANRAARAAARKADPRVKKSAAKRTAEAVNSDARNRDIDTRESMKEVVRTARRAVSEVEGRNMGVRSQTIARADKARADKARAEARKNQ